MACCIFSSIIIISHASEDNIMFTSYENGPACVILTLHGFFSLFVLNTSIKFNFINTGFFTSDLKLN